MDAGTPVVRQRTAAWSLALGVVALAVSVPGIAQAGGTFESLSLTGKPVVAGLGPRWSLPITLTTDGNLFLVVQRRTAAGDADASYSTRVKGVAFDCTPKLGSCDLSDADGLGTYGEVELTFTATARRTVKELTCTDSGVIHRIVYRRSGVLTGTLRLETKQPGLGVIRNGAGKRRVAASIPVTVTNAVSTGAHCPPVDATCREQVGFYAGPANLSGDRYLPKGKARFRWTQDRASSEPMVTRFQRISWRAPASDLQVNTLDSLGSAQMDLDAGAPFLTGGALFAAGEPKVDGAFPGCSEAEARGGAVLVSMTVDLPWQPAFTFEDEVDASLLHIIE